MSFSVDRYRSPVPRYGVKALLRSTTGVTSGAAVAVSPQPRDVPPGAKGIQWGKSQSSKLLREPLEEYR